MKEATIIRSEKLLSTKSAVLDAVKHNRYILYYTPQYADDYDVVLAAVTHYDRALRHVSARLRDNKHIVLTAVTQNGYVVEYASDRLKNDREVIFAALTQCGQSLKHLSDKTRDDYELVLVAVMQYGYAIIYASDRLKNNHNIALAACSKDGKTYEFLSPELKNDKDIIFASVSSNGAVLGNIPKEFRAQYTELDLIALKSSAFAFPYVSFDLQQNYDVVLDAVSRAGEVLRYVLPEFKEDRTIVLAAVKSRGDALRWTPTKFRNDREIVLTAVSNIIHTNPITHASDELKNDYEIARTALSNNCGAWWYISNTLKNNREFLFDIAKSKEYQILPMYDKYNKLQKDDDLLIEIIKSHYAHIEPYRYYSPIIVRPITNIKFIHRLINIDLPEYIVFDSMYFTLRRAKCVASMNIPWVIKDDILLQLFR